MDKWNSLDNAAKANLGKDSFYKFDEYKNKLKEDGHSWYGDAEDILTGWIWDELETT